MIIGILIIVAIVLLAIYVTKTYNTFITLGERVKNAKAQIITQIESRFDAVNSLIQLTKKYEKHETETLEKVVRQRMGLSPDTPIEKIEQDEDQLEQLMSRLIAISESYPDLKASDVYVKTMENVNTYENNVRHARMIYNDVVTKFNRMALMFPTNIIALIFNMTEKEYFQGTDRKQAVPSLE